MEQIGRLNEEIRTLDREVEELERELGGTTSTKSIDDCRREQDELQDRRYFRVGLY